MQQGTALLAWRSRCRQRDGRLCNDNLAAGGGERRTMLEYLSDKHIRDVALPWAARHTQLRLTWAREARKQLRWLSFVGVGGAIGLLLPFLLGYGGPPVFAVGMILVGFLGLDKVWARKLERIRVACLRALDEEAEAERVRLCVEIQLSVDQYGGVQ